MTHIFASLYLFVSAKSFSANASAACATATRPVKSRWPIISIVRTPFALATYSFPNTSPYRLSSRSRPTLSLSKRTQALSRSTPWSSFPCRR